MVNNSELERFY